MPLMWHEGLLKGGQFWQALMDSLAIDMVTRMAHGAFAIVYSWGRLSLNIYIQYIQESCGHVLFYNEQQIF